MKKIGILTGGGDAPGLNAVIRSVVLTCHNELGVEVVGIRDGFGGFAEGDGGLMPLDRRAVRGLLWRGGSILGCNNRYKGETQSFVDRMNEIGLDGLVVAGGDGTLTMAEQMYDLGACVVGVPKTIDNDVEGTDVTFGFDTAVTLVAEMCSRLIDTAESHHRVMIAEVMGRNAGHIALHGALAGSADVALIPEIHYRVDRVVDVIKRRAEMGRTYTLIVVAEGAVEADGELVLDEHRTAMAGREVLGGAGAVLAAKLRGQVGHEVRALSLSHLQRGGMPTVFDRNLATRMGALAAAALANGKSGVFTAYRNSNVLLAPLGDAAGKIRRVDPRGDLVTAARSVGLCFG